MLRRTSVRLWNVMTKVTGSEASGDKADSALHKVESGRVEKPAEEKVEHVSGERKDRGFGRVKSNRFAMLLGYQGKNYFGMQVQNEKGESVCPTIESHILDAMFQLGWISESLRQTPFDFYFQRAARTDKGVSAVRQMISAQLPISANLPEEGAAAINALLPDDIRVFGFKRTTKSFHSQKNCDGRTYSYTLPTFAFARPHELTNTSFRITPETLKKINEVLLDYKGSHNFFNYTSKRSFGDRSCNRYIISFEVGLPFIFHDEFRNEDVEFVTCTVKGQSFMLHQIRKMIGMMITIVREMQDASTIKKSYTSAERMDVPKAPGLGLLLERLHYDKYDKQFGSKPPHSSLTNWGDEVEADVEKLKTENIIKDIMQTEVTTQSMMQWLSDLLHHNFHGSEEGEVADFVSGAAKTAKKAKEYAESSSDNEVEDEAQGECGKQPAVAQTN